MAILFNREVKLVETDYREKPYFSDHQGSMTIKDKCFVCILGLLGCLFTMNIIVYSIAEKLMY